MAFLNKKISSICLIIIGLNFLSIFSNAGSDENVNFLDLPRRLFLRFKANKAQKHFINTHSNVKNANGNEDVAICRDAIAAILWQMWNSSTQPDQWVATEMGQQIRAYNGLKTDMEKLKNLANKKATSKSSFEDCRDVFIEVRNYEMFQAGIFAHLTEKTAEEMKKVADRYYSFLKE